MKAWNWNGNKFCEVNEETKALHDKMPLLSSATSFTFITTFRRFHGFESTHIHFCAFLRRYTLAGGTLQLSVYHLFCFFFPFPSFISCRRWHITISGQKSSLLSSSRETVPVLHFRLTSGGALKACWLNFLSFPLDTLFKHDAWRSA